MTNSPTVLVQADQLRAACDSGALQTPLTLGITTGLTAITGDEGAGKTLLLRLLCGLVTPASGRLRAVDACCLDLRLPDDDEHTPQEVWQRLQAQFPKWDSTLCADLSEALHLEVHQHKPLFQLSSGSRRKVGIVASLASGATLIGLDQPWMALDMASIHVLRDFLREAATHPSRAWMVADYEADATLPWRQLIAL